MCLLYFHYKRVETNVCVVLGRHQLVFEGAITSRSYVQTRLLPRQNQANGNPNGSPCSRDRQVRCNALPTHGQQRHQFDVAYYY
jgi:hypothetical protein